MTLTAKNNLIHTSSSWTLFPHFNSLWIHPTWHSTFFFSSGFCLVQSIASYIYIIHHTNRSLVMHLLRTDTLICDKISSNHRVVTLLWPLHSVSLYLRPLVLKGEISDDGILVQGQMLLWTPCYSSSRYQKTSLSSVWSKKQKLEINSNLKPDTYLCSG